MKRYLILLLILLASCTYPAPSVTPTTPAPIVTETVTPAPYPNPIDYGEIGHNPYPAPVQPASVEDKGELEAPTCGTNIEYPSRVYTLPNAPDDAYSETCIWSQLAGSSLVLYDQDGATTRIGGDFIGRFPPNCYRYNYRLNSNGVWSVQVMVQDPGGVNLCSLSPVVLERWRYIFIELWRP